jgi:hypothetical protein
MRVPTDVGSVAGADLPRAPHLMRLALSVFDAINVKVRGGDFERHF